MSFKIVVEYLDGTTEEAVVGNRLAIMVPLLVVNSLKPLLGKLDQVRRLTVERVS